MDKAAKALPGRKTRRTREEQKADRSRELLAAAWVMFCEKGYEAVTIDDVAEHAGYSRMPIYSLFGDKQNLFFELWRTKTTALLDMFASQFKPGLSLRKNLEQLARTTVAPPLAAAESEAGMGESLFFVAQTIALSRPELEDKIIAVARTVIGEFARAIRESTLEPGDKLRGDPEGIAAHLVAHINGMSTVRFQTRDNYVTKARDLTAIFHAIAFKNAGE